MEEALTTISSQKMDIEVNTLAGNTHAIKVPTGASAIAVREAVAAAMGIPTIEVGLLDNATGKKLTFGSSEPLETMPRNLTLIRSKRWASIPEGCHYEKLSVTEDRLKVSVDDDETTWFRGFFFSEPLERSQKYSIKFKFEGCQEGAWIGTTRDDATKWDWMPGIYFYECMGSCGTDSGDAFAEWKGGTAKHDKALMTACFSGAPSTIVVDTTSGLMELLAEDGSLAASIEVPHMQHEHSLRFCASFAGKGQCFTILDALVD